MAIADYATLQTSVAAWLARADLTSIIPDFITLAETRINRDLRVRQMITEATGTAAGGLIPLPSDFIAPVAVSLSVGGYDQPLKPLTSAGAINDRLTGIPFGYAVEGSNLRLIGGAGTEAYSLTYYASVPALSAGVNWLITAAPDVYLYACLVEATPYLRQDSRVELWVGAYKAAISALQRHSDDARFSPSATIRLGMRTP